MKKIEENKNEIKKRTNHRIVSFEIMKKKKFFILNLSKIIFHKKIN